MLAPALAVAQVTSYLFVPNINSDNLHVIETISRTVLPDTPIVIGDAPGAAAVSPSVSSP